MLDGTSAIALGTAIGAAGPLRIVVAWAVCSVVASIVVGFMLHVGHGESRDLRAGAGPGQASPPRAGLRPPRGHDPSARL